MAQIEINLRDLYRVVRKRKWILTAAPILMGLATFAVTPRPQPVYNAEALLKISRSTTLAGLMTDIISYSAYDNMATQIMVITSQPVLKEVAHRLRLIQGDNSQEAIDQLKGQISAEQRSSSDILAIKASADSDKNAIQLANTTAEAYIQQYSAEKDKRLNETVQFIQKRLLETTRELDEAERNLGNFKRANAATLSLTAAPGVDFQEKQFQYQQKLQDARAALATLTQIQQSKNYDALLQSYLHVDDAGVRALVDEVTRRSTAVADLRSKKADLLRYQTEESPQVINLSGQLTTDERRLQSQITDLVRRLNALATEYERLHSTLAHQQSEFLRQPEVYSQLDSLQNIVKEKQELTSILRKQYQDAEIQQKEKVEEIAIVERANSATTLPQPGRIYKSLIGALIGILIGGVFAFVLESMDTSIGTIEEVERYIEAAVLGIIPHIEPEDVKSRMKLDQLPSSTAREDLNKFAQLVTHFDPKSVASEAYRTLRTNINSIMVRTNKKVFLVSSSVIQEGKSTSCTNLATVFAQTGQKTLLIDADLRRPSTDKIFGIEKAPGLTDILQGTRELKECSRTIDDFIMGKFGLKLAQTTPGLEYLHLLPAGRSVDNPTELLNSPAMDKLLLEVRKNFDVIALDVSPVLPVADAYVLAPKVDGVILAYQIGRVAREVVKRAKLRIETLGATVWGIIMNDIQAEIDYKRTDFQYYHYGYTGDMRPVSRRWWDRLKGPFGGRTPSKPRRKPAPPPQLSRTPQFPPSHPAKDQELRDIMALTDDEKS